MANPTLTLNERTTLVLTLTFRDEDDVLVTPTAVYYRIDDASSGTSIVDNTALGSLSSAMELEITTAQNRSLSQASLEERVVTVEFDYGSGRHGSNEYRYLLKNLYYVDAVSPSVSPSSS